MNFEKNEFYLFRMHFVELHSLSTKCFRVIFFDKIKVFDNPYTSGQPLDLRKLVGQGLRNYFDQSFVSGLTAWKLKPSISSI